jgi:hypothetical protein
MRICLVQVTALIGAAMGLRVAATAQVSKPPAPSITFEQQVLPLIENRCVKCHSGSDPAGKLDVRTRAALIKGGSQGSSVVPGEPAKSSLYNRIKNGQMPLGGPPMTASEAELIRTWIEAGAPAANPEQQSAREPGRDPRDREHWAFQTPKRAATPKVRNAVRLRTPIDAFILAELEKKRLGFSPDADAVTLVRRAYFDLIGLPPTPDEVDSFVNDKAPDRWEKLIDRLLASPRYGERWARHWLDVAGYADSEGGEAADLVRPDAWRYRDYVIRSLNSDKPFDRFLVEQLAGDEVSEYWKEKKFTPDTVEKLEATGFLRMAVDGSLDTHPKELNLDYLWKAAFDTYQIVSTSVLGLSMQCARCHDHKYDPISQKDYYRLLAIFSGALRPDDPTLVSAKRTIIDATAEDREHAAKINKIQDPIIKALRDLKKARAAQYAEKHAKGKDASEAELKQTFPEYAALANRLENELKDEETKRINLPSIRALVDVDSKPPKTRVLSRGDYTAARLDDISPGLPSVLDNPEKPFHFPETAIDGKSTGRRLTFAKWLTGPDNPLTARVVINRVWANHFGRGIVPSLDDFGRSGDPPTNQALLDWLATEFVQRGWRLKDMHRLLMTSTVYRQASQNRPECAKVDADNKLLWRMSPRRLEAESVRDAILSIAGTLDVRMYGEPVKSEVKPSGEVAPENDAAGGRRSIYLLVRRSAPQTFLNVMNAPVMEINCTKRASYSSASQALTLMNSDFTAAHAEHLARRILSEIPDPATFDERKAVERSFRFAFARMPSPAETDFLLSFVHKQADYYKDADTATRRLRTYSDLGHALFTANEFVYID